MDLLNNLYLQGAKLWDVLTMAGAAGGLYALFRIHRYFRGSIRHILAVLALPVTYVGCVAASSFLGVTAISHRYYEPVAPFLLLFSALGVYSLCRDVPYRIITYGVLIVLFGGMLADAVSPPVKSLRRAHTRAGRWLRSQDPEYDDPVFSTHSQVSYYAGMTHVPAGGARKLYRQLPDVAESVRYAVFEAESVRLREPGEGDARGSGHGAAKRPGVERIETGVVQVDHHWKTVKLRGGFENPVIVTGPPTMHGSEPGTVRCDSLSPGSFDVHFQEWPELDGSHLRETVRWMAVESGCWPKKQRCAVEARNVRVSADGWQHVKFEGRFAATPVVFTQVHTTNTETAVTARIQDVTKEGFDVALFARGGSLQGEDVSMIAVDPRVSGLGGSRWRVGTASAEIGAEPVVVRVAGTDYTLRLQGPGWNREEKDTESERLGLMCLAGKPEPLAQIQSTAGPGHAVVRRGGPGRFWLRQHVRDEEWDLIYSEGSRNLRIYRNPSAVD